MNIIKLQEYKRFEHALEQAIYSLHTYTSLCIEDRCDIIIKVLKFFLDYQVKFKLNLMDEHLQYEEDSEEDSEEELAIKKLAKISISFADLAKMISKRTEEINASLILEKHE